MKHVPPIVLAFSMAVLHAAPAAAQEAAALLTPPQLRIHPVTGNGAATIRIQNATPAAADIVLTAVPAESLPNDAVVTFAREGTAAPGAVSLRVTIAPNSVERVAMAVDGVRNAGDYSIDLYAGATKIGTVVARRAALGLSVETPPEGQSVALVDGTPSDRVLTNADPFPYAVKWDWSAGGKKLCTGDVESPAHAPVLLTCIPSVERSFREVFRQPVVQSVLTMQVDTKPASGQVPVFKQQAIAATVASIGPASSQMMTYFVLIIVLIAGGVASLLLNTALPNFLQKLSLREQLLGLAIRIGNLSTNIDSRIRVLVRLERSRLIDLLRSRWTLSPDFATVVTQCTSGIAQLKSRVDALQQLDLVIERLGNAMDGDVPPTLVEQVETLQRHATALLVKTEPTETDLRDALAAIAEASKQVEALGDPGEEFGIKLVARVNAVRDVAKTIDGLQTWTEIKRAVAWPWNAVASVADAATTVPSAQYVQLDGAVRRVEIMQQYAQLSVGRLGAGSAELAALEPSEQEHARARLKLLGEHEATMKALLGTPSYGAWMSAHRLLHQIGEKIFSDDLKAFLAAQPPGAEISMEPDIAYERAPLTFSVKFYDQFVNDAAARHDWTCEWDFGDGLTGRGWTVSHYFLLRQSGPRNMFNLIAPIRSLFNRSARVRNAPVTGGVLPSGVFKVTAHVRDATGRLVQRDGQNVMLTREVTVLRSGQGARFESRVWAEAAKLAAALLIAIFGLVAGAQEQLVKLDIVPGLVAVFLVGFGADTIKNLLTAKS